ncbi:MAG: hypothetical protein LBD93_07000 [Treponema sp.]|nr:hypothetical protein [Treponema sp.]
MDTESYPVFKRYDGKDSRLFETTATTSTIWGFSYQAIYKIIYGYLCSLWFNKDGSLYCIVQQPDVAGASLQDLVDTLYKLYQEAGFPALQIWAVEERFLEWYQHIQGYAIKAEYSDDWSEYAYRTKDILELSGGVNFYKRKRLKPYLNMPHVSIIPLTKENFHICFEVEEAWCHQQDCPLCESFSGCAKKSLELMADIFDERIHKGILGYIDNMPVGYAICEQINKQIVILYFGKASIANFNVSLYYMVIKMYFSSVVYLNNGHDMGKDGLRIFKKHLSTHELWRKYLCTFTKAGDQSL